MFGVCEDKLLHVVCCICLMILFRLIYKKTNHDTLFANLTVLLIAGLGKEILFDNYMQLGICDSKDMIANCLGMFIGNLK